MNQQQAVHNLIILDESGSMASIKSSIIQGFNELVQTVKGLEQQYPEQQHTISLVSFNGLGKKVLHFMDPAGALQEINKGTYHPQANTPLFDAMGFSIHKLDEELNGRSDYNVLVTILTDGEENASKQYDVRAVRKLVSAMEEKGWTFTYIGTDHDVDKMADALAIKNKMAFLKEEAHIRDMFMREREARERYSERMRSKEDLRDKYFDE
jgi:uncharacterized protein YegL